MFVYQTKKAIAATKDVEAHEVDSLIIMFQSTQIPAGANVTPDVEIYKDGDTVHCVIGGTDHSGTIE